MSDVSDDPGWRPSARMALAGLVPGLLPRRIRQGRGGEGVALFRTLFLSFSGALVGIGVVVVILTANHFESGSLPSRWVLLAVGLVGLATVAAPSLLTPPLLCGDDALLASSYRQRFFVRVALAEGAALVGFVGFILSGVGWSYFLGAAFAAVGFVRLAPTAGHLRRDQDELHSAGCHRSLLAALRSVAPGPPRAGP